LSSLSRNADGHSQQGEFKTVTVAKLLVSVRSGHEARQALAGGASIIDVKEPDHGPLGRASASVWSDVRDAVAKEAPLSVALGELSDWLGPSLRIPLAESWTGISYRKLGLSAAGVSWLQSWRWLRSLLDVADGPAWIAVVYADWQEANAPSPTAILEEALNCTNIVGVLVDTWDKFHRANFDFLSGSWRADLRNGGKMLALAGGLDASSIPRLEPFAPDIVAVRGAACVGGDRKTTIESRRVAELAQAVAELPGLPETGWARAFNQVTVSAVSGA
jgi:uncharacterized protein (UPF0264 family)